MFGNIKYSLVITIFLFLCLYTIPVQKIHAQMGGIPNTVVVVGEEEYASGPMRYSYDSQLVIEQYNGKYHGYYGGGGTPGQPSISQHYISSDLNSLFFDQNRQSTPIMSSTPGYPNEVCGTWVNNIIRLSSTKIAAIYHSEKNCVNATTEKTMSYAISNDNGATWDKKGPILSVYDGERSLCPDCDDAGDATVVKRNGYFYMFSTETTKDGWRQALARASVQADGLPGSWYKYYNGQYNEPALGGKFTPIPNGQFPGTRVVFNKTFKNFMSIGTSGKWGFIIHNSYKENPTQTLPYFYFFPEVSAYDDPNVDDWKYYEVNPNRLELYSYSVAVDPDNLNGDIDNDFYFYYTKIAHNQDFNNMYMMRRRIKLIPTTSTSKISYFPLNQYALPGKTRTTIVNPVNENPNNKILMGYLSYTRSPNANQLMLYECYIDIYQGYKLQTNPCTGAKHIRKLGYIEKNQTAQATIPLKECFNPTTSKHYYVTNDTCNAGDTSSWTWGYLYPQQFIDSLSTCSLKMLGDANCDNKVDTLDYVCWLQEFNTGNKPSGCNSADFDEAGGVSILDYSIWFSSFTP